MAFLPFLSGDKEVRMLVTERGGKVRLIENGKLMPDPVATISKVKQIGEGGLLGVTVHPDFKSNNFIYLLLHLW